MCWLATRTKQLLLHRTFNIPGTYNHLPMVPNYLLVLDSLVGGRAIYVLATRTKQPRVGLKGKTRKPTGRGDATQAGVARGEHAAADPQ